MSGLNLLYTFATIATSRCPSWGAISSKGAPADPIIDERSDLCRLGCVPYEMLALLRQHRDWAIGVGPRTDLAAKPIIGVTVRPLTSRQ